MKITIQPGGGQAYTLCDGADRSLESRCGPQGLRINGRRLEQAEDLLRATAGVTYNRGNKRTVVTFGVSVNFATVEKAEAFLLLHSTELPGSGLVRFEAGSGGPTRQLAVALLVADGIEHIGASVRMQYEIHGGAMAAGSSPV
jgi:hypothetical protein